MKKTAKLISIVLCLMIAFGTVFAIAVNANASSAPSFELVTDEVDDDTITVSVKLVSGQLNAIDAQFEATEGAKCVKIVSGADWKDVENSTFMSNKDNGKISAAATGTFDNGVLAVATFDVDYTKGFSITFKTTNCKISDGTVDSDVTKDVTPVTVDCKPAPVDPVDPTEPSKPEDPTEPSKPEDPTEPSKPEDPTEPSKPEDPTEPSKPEDPTEPSKPEDPTEPSKPEDPTEPSKPEDPTEPSKPEDPTEPSKPEEPTDPTTPAEPTDPTTPAEPTDPTTPAEPTDPTTPAEPTDPADPADPVTPADPSSDKKDDTSAKADDGAAKADTVTTGSDAISPNTGDGSRVALCAVVTAMSGAAITLVLRKKNESEE